MITGGWDRGPGARGHFGLRLCHDSTFAPFDVETMPVIPRGNTVTVTGEENHQEVLATLIGTRMARLGRGPAGRVEVAIGGASVGRLTAKMSARYAELVDELDELGVPATCTALVNRSDRQVEVTLLLSKG
jgi:hypothetical protein